MKTRSVKTKSGLSIGIISFISRNHRHDYAHEHPWIVRFTHWLNAFTLVIMTTSGLQIFAAFPSFGPRVPQTDLVHVPEAIRLGGWLGGALQWHLTFMWLFIATGLAYLGYLFVSGHWRRVILQPRDLGGIWPMVRHYFLFREKPEQREPYNPLQKLAYTSTIVFGIASVVTGWMLYKPVQSGWLVRAAGGFDLVRLWHFAAMIGFLGFIPGHLIMVIVHGWNNFSSMLTGFKRDPQYLDTSDTDHRNYQDSAA